MRELRTEIDISAPLTKVWGILTDVDHWTQWNPTVNQASGSATPGSKLSLTMCSGDCKEGHNFTPIVTDVEEPKSFRWHGTMIADFLFSNDKFLELEEISSGTRLIHREQFSGLLVPLFWNKLNQGVGSMLKSMNEALKVAAEKESE